MRDPLFGFPGWWPRHKSHGRVTHRLLYAYAEQEPASDCGGEVWTPLGGPYRYWHDGQRLYVAECQRCKRILLIECWPFGGTKWVVREMDRSELEKQTT